MFNNKQLETLNSPLENNRIKNRSKGNVTLSYLGLGIGITQSQN